MKQPQCNSAAECLRELARVMDQFGIEYTIQAVNSKYVRFNGTSYWTCVPTFGNPVDWQFAIAEVEGKPVFIGDELYYFDRKIIAGAVINGVIANAAGGMNYSPSSLSWNPPKPATVMVEHLVKDAETYARNRWIDSTHQRTADACKKALEQIK